MTDTLSALFFKTAEKNPDRVALRFKEQGDFSGVITWRLWAEMVQLTAQGLFMLGVKHGDRIGILAENGPAWTFADLGALTIGAVVVPLYPTLSGADLSFIIKNSGMKVLFVSTPEQYEKVRALDEQFQKIKIVTFYENPPVPSIGLNELHRQASLKNILESVSLMRLQVCLHRITTYEKKLMCCCLCEKLIF